MAEITAIKLRDTEVPLVEGGAIFDMRHKFDLSATEADSADTIVVFECPADVRIVDSKTHIAATLGASCTVQLRHNDGTTQTTLGIATTAGQANTIYGNAKDIDANKGDKIELLVAGADIAAASADNEVTVRCYRR